MNVLKQSLNDKGLKDLARLNNVFFTRTRVFSFKRLTLFIINLAKKSLQLELYDFSEISGCEEVTKQAFSKARKKLNPNVFKQLNKKLVNEFYTDNDFKTFKGLRVLSIDGSKIQLPSSLKLAESYGRSINLTRKGLVMAQASVLFDSLNKITISSILSPYHTSENIQAFNLIDNLVDLKQKTKDLLVFDRGYPSIHLILKLMLEKKDFLMRCQRNFIQEVREISTQKEIDKIVKIKCSNLSYTTKRLLRKTKIFNENQEFYLRLSSHRLPSGELEILLTSLKDKKYTKSDLFNLYQMRWNIEENYKFIKAIAKVENFSGKSKIAIEQDFFATMLTCNIASLFVEEVENEINEENKHNKIKYKYKPNKNIALGIIKNKLIETLLLDKDLDEFCDYIKTRIKKSLVQIRKNRRFSRNKSVCRNHAINRRSCM